MKNFKTTPEFMVGMLSKVFIFTETIDLLFQQTGSFRVWKNKNSTDFQKKEYISAIKPTANGI